MGARPAVDWVSVLSLSVRTDRELVAIREACRDLLRDRRVRRRSPRWRVVLESPAGTRYFYDATGGPAPWTLSAASATVLPAHEADRVALRLNGVLGPVVAAAGGWRVELVP